MLARRSDPESGHRSGTAAENEDEGALLARVAAGEERAFRALVDRHLPSVLGIARRNVNVTDAVPEESEPAGQLRHLAERELAGRVDAALKALPERQRLALTLFHYEGMSQIEVGNTLGISDEAVESLLARARRTLKAALAEQWRGLIPEQET